jgi:uncharacterized GH25 family protein
MLFTFRRPNRTIRIFIALLFCALFLVRASAQQPPAATPAKASKGSIIRGRVVYADTGRPLRRAEVLLFGQENQESNDTAVTDRSGEFVFENISAGRYIVVVSAPDIVDQLEKSSTLGSLNLKIALGQIEDGFSEVTVDGRNSVKTEIRASRGGVVTGRVLSENDEPIAKAEIKLFEIDNGKLRPANVTERYLDRQRLKFQTDSRGIYRIAGLATGEYVVRASESNERGNPDDAAEGSYTNGSMMVAFHPTAQRVEDATRVKVQQGAETTGVDIHLADRVGHRLSGTLLLRGKAASGAQLRLTRKEPDMEGYGFGEPHAESDRNGNWEIRTVPDGTYTLLVTGSYVGIISGGREQAYTSITPLRRELTVAGTDLTDLKIELVEGAALNGVVSVEGGTSVPDRLIVELVPQDVRAAPGVEESNSSDERDAIASTLVGEKGLFDLSKLPTGSFYFRLPGLGTRYYVKSITLKDKDLLRNPLKIEDSRKLDGVRIVLSSDVVSVSGRAVEKSDRSKPLTDAAVLLFPAEAERRRVSVEPIAARTDKEGRFVVKAAPGDYFVFVFNRRRKDIPIALPTETSLIKNSSTLQKISVQREDQKKVVEVVGP